MVTKPDDLDFRESTYQATDHLPATCLNGDCRHAEHRVRRGHRTGTGYGYGAYGGFWVAPLSPDQFAGSPQADTGAGEGTGGDSGGDGGGGDGGGI